MLIYVTVYTNSVRWQQTSSVRDVLQTYWVADTTPKDFWDRLEESSTDVKIPCGLSDIGRELDLWPSAVQKWRDGVSLPSRNNMITLAKHRGVNLEWLWTGRGPKLAESEMDANTRELLTLWNLLPEDAQKRLLDAARYETRVAPSPSEPAAPADATVPKPFRPTVLRKGPIR